jgi:saccharopine dehydrogenase-like NADP-dependent oxidoreductase
MGSGVIRDLISDRSICPISEIRVCDLSGARMDRLIGDLHDSRLSRYVLDVADGARLHGALAGVDLCVNAVPTLSGFQIAIFEAALAAGVDYLDLGGLGIFTVQQKAAHERFKKAGVTAVIGAGSDPGMSNVICRLVADELDSIERINLYWACERVGPESPVLTPPYSLSTVLAEYARPSIQFLAGRHTEVAPLAGLETLDLPEPFGKTEFIFTPHSEQLTVPLADGIRDKGIKEFTWRLHLPRREHEAWVGLIKAGFGDFEDAIMTNGVAVRPLDVLQEVISRNIERKRDSIPIQTSHEIHFAIAHGIKDGVSTKVQCDVVIKPDALYDSYVDAGTSMNASIAAQLILMAPTRPGVWAPEEYFVVEPYVAELRKRKFAVTTQTTRLAAPLDGQMPAASLAHHN